MDNKFIIMMLFAILMFIALLIDNTNLLIYLTGLALIVK